MGGKKVALIVGINYTGTENELSGCINDAKNMEEFLLKNGYNSEDITLLTDDTQTTPTKENILIELYKMIVSDAKYIFFHFSGHGSQVPDQDGDEKDGYDECILPLDYKEKGILLDDTLRGQLYSLDTDQSMFCILDCCHSGSGMDLKYNLYQRCNGKNSMMIENKKERETRGQCVMLSGCLDNQTSADAFMEGIPQGALTYSFLRSVSGFEGAKTYEELIVAIKKILSQKGFGQIPDLSSGKKLKLKSKIKI